MSNKRTTFVSFFLDKIVIRTTLVLGILGFGWALADNSVLRWDLTEDQRFTIEEASHRIAAAVPDRLTIRAYFTKKLPERVVPFYRQVIDILREYEVASGGQIKLEQYDPSESSSAKKEAEGYGVRPVDLMIFEATARKKVQVWGSIVLLFRDRASETIDLAARYPQGYEGLSGLEYELSSRIWQLSNDKPTLGITGHLSSAPPNANPMNPMGGQPRPMFQGLRRMLGDAFTIEDIDLNQAEPDPAKIPCLMVVRPKEFNDVQQFRLDQYMMKGGRVLMFITKGERSPSMMGRGTQFKQFQTGLEDWLSHHGVRVPTEFVMHLRSSYPVPVQAEVAPGVVQDVLFPCPFFPIISRNMADCLSSDNPAIQPLRSTVFLWPHPVEIVESKLSPNVTANVLVRSSAKQSWRWRDMNRMNPKDAIAGIQSGTDMPTSFFSSPIIVAFEGEFDSFYASHPVPPSLSGDPKDKDSEKNDADDDDEDTTLEDDEEKTEKESGGPDVVKKSKKTHLVVVGNSFFISDLLLGGNSRDERGKEAAQVAFNLVDWLARSSELIALRAKKYTKRELSNPMEGVLDELETEYTEGKIDAETFKRKLNGALDEQKAERKLWRHMNSLGPAGAILLLGLVVWILRLAFRARPVSIPLAVDPEDEDIGSREDTVSGEDTASDEGDRA